MTNQSLLIILLVGLIAGWLAGQIMRGGGLGIVGDLIVGILGAFIGDWLLPRLGIHLGTGLVRDYQRHHRRNSALAGDQDSSRPGRRLGKALVAT